MKTFNKIMLATLLILSFFVLSCSKNSTSPNNNNNTTVKFTCTLNGGGYSNQAVNFTKAGIGGYSPADDGTGLSFAGSGSGESAIIAFAGKSTGTLTIGTGINGISINFGGTTGVVLLTGTLTVTSYGNVGGTISGTFSGSGMSLAGQAVTVTNGTFTATRSV